MTEISLIVTLNNQFNSTQQIVVGMCNLSVVLDRVGDRCVSSLGPQPSYTVSKLTWLTLCLGNFLPLRHRYIHHRYKAHGVLFIYFLRLTCTIVVKTGFRQSEKKWRRMKCKRNCDQIEWLSRMRSLSFQSRKKKRRREHLTCVDEKRKSG